MCALDKSYKGSWLYPKRIIETETMLEPERSFCTKLIDVLKDDINIDDLAFEQRNADYRTVVYSDWSNDFLRYHFGDDGFWVSVRVYPGIVADYEFSPLFRAQANKRQLHWRASVDADEIEMLHDVIVRSCRAFFGGPDTEKHKGMSGASKSKSRLQLQVEDLVEQTPELAGFLGDDFELLTARDATIAGTSYHAASNALRNGSALTCEHEKDNPYDSEAVAIYDERHEIVGYLPKDGIVKKTVLKAIASGTVVKAIVIDDGTDGGTRIKRKKIHVALIKL